MKTATKRTVIRGRRKFEWWMILAYIALPFYKLWKGLIWIYENLFFETTDLGWNGVYGPGGYNRTTTNFSWGKLSFIILLIILILVIIYII